MHRFNKYFHRKFYFHRTRVADELSPLQKELRKILKKMGTSMRICSIGGLDPDLDGSKPGQCAWSGVGGLIQLRPGL